MEKGFPGLTLGLEAIECYQRRFSLDGRRREQTELSSAPDPLSG